MKKWTFPVVFASALLFVPWKAMPQSPPLIRLPGHLKTESDVLKNSSAVAVATLLFNGQMNLGSVGMNIYSFVKLRIEQTLKGDAPNEIVATFTCMDAPRSVAETVPAVGQKYIIFFQHGRHDYPGQTNEILKFSEYNDAAIARIKGLINASQKPAN